MISMLAGGAVVIEMVTRSTVTIAVVVTVGALVEAAWIVIVPALDGAVQTVVPPLVVCAGTNAPQGAGVHVQSTPPFRLSFITVAAIDAV